MLDLAALHDSGLDGPMVLDIAAVDISRHLDDRRFALQVLRRDCHKLTRALRELRQQKVDR
eukprot:UN14459